MDPARFESLMLRLSRSLSRRRVAGGSLLALAMATAHPGEHTLASRKRVKAAACIPTGKRCPSGKARGRKKKRLGCNACCQGFSATGADGKGRTCACKPLDNPCTSDRSQDCCSGVCVDDRCQFAPCGAAGVACASGVECCSGSCVGGLCQAPFCVDPGAPCGLPGRVCCAGMCLGSGVSAVCCLGEDNVCNLADDQCCPGFTCVDNAGTVTCRPTV